MCRKLKFVQYVNVWILCVVVHGRYTIEKGGRGDVRISDEFEFFWIRTRRKRREKR